ncbi:hypothetical protein [Alteromonas halophila]|uniref:Uncharacterized protein n=1 Tax=Alteromonas halophila TaxID=516698 RepID=A0A918JMN7_9ALTE|nr:hypothetical protein [Alteromonas halophila]GGW90550.1 hypothetical protein GCM10007391_25980 [Alteromonas halophila]
MQTPYRQLKAQLPVQYLSIDVLLALRILFDKDGDIVNLDDDIRELAHHPERLNNSYRPEWEAYVTRAIAAELNKHPDQNVTQFVERILRDVEAVKDSSFRYDTLYEAVCRAGAVNDASNTSVFPTPWRQQIMALLLPVSTLPRE